MVEYFPSNREDSDDDVPSSDDVHRESVEHAVPPNEQQEGTIFSRTDLAPNLSRPLFDFIRKQEQSGAQAELESSASPDFLPSVSVPSEPEVRTYQPPVETASAERTNEDDDEEAGDQDHPSAQPHELHRPLNEQFEAIMRGEMGEDFTRLTSGDQLEEPVQSVTPQPAPATHHLPPLVSAPSASSESPAFYYSESESTDSSTPTPPGGRVPPVVPFAGGPHGMRTPDASSGAPVDSSESFGATSSESKEQQEDHKGRTFAAGFITGWVIKQHLANKKLAGFQETAEAKIKQRDEQINTMGFSRQTLQRKVDRVEGQLQAVETVHDAYPTAPRPPVEVASQATNETKAYEVQHGQHVEHATGGGHNIIVDKHGHEVQNSIEYGEEFQFQRRQEQARASASDDNSNNEDGEDVSSAPPSPPPGYAPALSLESGQVDPAHSLPVGIPSPTVRQHLLASKNSNPIVATIASPWLWAALVVLLLAFFVAAFI
ncbi:MAG TPA: hypothetical protein VLH38_05510 [Patescibacteria group bacterium]|nr:hypothetical protein [Patescibacteria group bacterium]